MSFASFAELLADRAREHSHQVCFRFLSSEENALQTRTCAELDVRSRQIAGYLRERTEPGDRALLLFPSGLDFIDALFGCFYAGLVAVPLPPPLGLHMLVRLQETAQDARPAVGLTTQAMLQRVRSRMDELPSLSKFEWIALEEIGTGP